MKTVKGNSFFQGLGFASFFFFMLITSAAAQPERTFIPTGSMQTARYEHTATLLKDGRVLITGGCTYQKEGDSTASLSSAEIYNPADETFSTTGSMSEGRAMHTATLLNDGRVLIVGGSRIYMPWEHIYTAEIYDPVNGNFGPAFPIQEGDNAPFYCDLHAAVLLGDGNVLIVSNQAIIYETATGTFRETIGKMSIQRPVDPRPVKLNSGKVLIVGGGWDADFTAEVYDPVTDSFEQPIELTDLGSRWGHTATLLTDGTVLVVGGGGTSPTNTAELFDPDSNFSLGSFSYTGDTVQQRVWHEAVRLQNGEVLVAGGNPSPASAEIYNPADGIFSATASMSDGRGYHTATLLNDGRVLIVGGQNLSPLDPQSLSSAELYTPAFISVAIDIKPGSYPNTFNQNEHGVIPVAILGSESLNTRDIDISSLLMQGLTIKMAGKSSHYLAHFCDSNNDGYEDLIVQFQDSDAWVIPGNGNATLTGELYNGVQIKGFDSITIVP